MYISTYIDSYIFVVAIIILYYLSFPVFVAHVHHQIQPETNNTKEETEEEKKN